MYLTVVAIICFVAGMLTGSIGLFAYAKCLARRNERRDVEYAERLNKRA